MDEREYKYISISVCWSQKAIREFAQWLHLKGQAKVQRVTFLLLVSKGTYVQHLTPSGSVDRGEGPGKLDRSTACSTACFPLVMTMSALHPFEWPLTGWSATDPLVGQVCR